ncbi:mechanosensitive ion channel protein 2, chloroplastic-like [Chenopodium quinoa]|uniref:mechanosensitive ion channel protein 2, chloroplastic-like n=1 Tax=Chenopodium quinoa TaxID=63459 RepID=UPI000B784B57|nr:mechanosensitive ion channel protein 2, chloroplastic-like [Chenopodium quinoa]
MALTGSLQLSPSLGICKSQERSRQFKYVTGRGNQHLLFSTLSSCASRQDSWTHRLSSSVNKPLCSLPYRCSVLKCHSFLFLGHNVSIPSMETASVALTRSCNALQASPLLNKLVPAVGIIIFTLWGLGPLMRMSRNIFLKKTDSTWKKSTTNLVLTSYLQPMLLWTGLFLICRALDPIVMPTEASELVKQRSLSFVKSLSTVLAFAYCLSSVIQQVQKYLMEANDPSDARNMGFQFAGKAVYSAVWVAAVSLFIELLGFSTQKWMTAGGLGTVLLTLAGREIFTNFLSSIMIHATRPFVLNEWIQTKIEGYEVSGTVEHVGWWSPTIIRGEDREAVHIPNHKFTVNVVRNLSQKSHWRIKTHLAISHLDVSKINNIVADMRKVLAKNPQVEQQKLHRRVFLENINPENQALLILISCFVKTSHHEEYLCVKEGILLDLLRVVSHHRARLATPIRTIQKYYNEPDLDNMSFSSSFFTRGGPVSKSQMLLIEPPYKINGEDKSKSQARTVRGIGEQDSRGTGQPPGEQKTDESKVKGTSAPDLDKKENVKHGNKAEGKVGETLHSRSKDENKASVASKMDWKADSKPTGNSTSRPILELEKDTTDAAGSQSKTAGSVENTSKNSENVLPPLNTETHVINDKTTGSQSKQVEKSTSSESSKQTSASLEENIVLGVALEGSKRTLPIEDELDSPPTPAEAKDLAARSSGPGNSAGEKDGKDK